MTTNEELLCPLCGNKNLCMAYSSEPCWCSKVTISKQLIKEVPTQYKNKACICQACIKKFKRVETVDVG